jgi:hypothetical protein
MAKTVTTLEDTAPVCISTVCYNGSHKSIVMVKWPATIVENPLPWASQDGPSGAFMLPHHANWPISHLIHIEGTHHLAIRKEKALEIWDFRGPRLLRDLIVTNDIIPGFYSNGYKITSACTLQSEVVVLTISRLSGGVTYPLELWLCDVSTMVLRKLPAWRPTSITCGSPHSIMWSQEDGCVHAAEYKDMASAPTSARYLKLPFGGAFALCCLGTTLFQYSWKHKTLFGLDMAGDKTQLRECVLREFAADLNIHSELVAFGSDKLAFVSRSQSDPAYTLETLHVHSGLRQVLDEVKTWDRSSKYKIMSVGMGIALISANLTGCAGATLYWPSNGTCDQLDLLPQFDKMRLTPYTLTSDTGGRSSGASMGSKRRKGEGEVHLNVESTGVTQVRCQIFLYT